MEPINYYNDPALQQAQGTAQQAAQGYSKAVTNASTLPDLLKQALDKKFSENNPLIQGRESALKNYMTVAETAPQSVLPENNQGMVFSPLEQSGMIAGRRAGAFAPISSYNEMIGWQKGGIQDVIAQATKTYEALARAKQAEAEQARQNYQDLLDLAGKKASQATSDRQFNENVRQFGLEYALKQAELAKGSSADQDRKRYNEMVKDIKGKMTLPNILTKYGSDFTPDQIYGVYNTASPWGSAKESPDVLARWGIKTIQTETAEQRNRRASIEPALLTINNIDDTKLDKLGPNNAYASITLNTPLGGIGVNKDVAQLYSQFEGIRQTALKAFQGGRLSDKDYERIVPLIPLITDQPWRARQKILELKSILSEMGGGGLLGNTKPPLSSFDK